MQKSRGWCNSAPENCNLETILALWVTGYVVQSGEVSLKSVRWHLSPLPGPLADMLLKISLKNYLWWWKPEKYSTCFITTKTKQNIFDTTGVFVLFSFLFSPSHINSFSFKNAYFLIRFRLPSILKRLKVLKASVFTCPQKKLTPNVFKTLHFQNRFQMPPFSSALRAWLTKTHTKVPKGKDTDIVVKDKCQGFICYRASVSSFIGITSSKYKVFKKYKTNLLHKLYFS